MCQSIKESWTEELTLHCCACGLREEWDKKEIDEVDEGQAIVPEQASCRNKKDTKIQIKQQINPFNVHKLSCVMNDLRAYRNV